MPPLFPTAARLIWIEKAAMDWTGFKWSSPRPANTTVYWKCLFLRYHGFRDFSFLLILFNNLQNRTSLLFCDFLPTVLHNGEATLDPQPPNSMLVECEKCANCLVDRNIECGGWGLRVHVGTKNMIAYTKKSRILDFFKRFCGKNTCLFWHRAFLETV